MNQSMNKTRKSLVVRAKVAKKNVRPHTKNSSALLPYSMREIRCISVFRYMLLHMKVSCWILTYGRANNNEAASSGSSATLLRHSPHAAFTARRGTLLCSRAFHVYTNGTAHLYFDTAIWSEDTEIKLSNGTSCSRANGYDIA